MTEVLFNSLIPVWNRQESAANIKDHIDLSRTQWLYWDKYKEAQCSHYRGTACDIKLIY